MGPEGDSCDWPGPVEAINIGGSSSILLICEHASNHIPSAYLGLGLDEADLQRHIAWDIGAADLTRALSTHLDAEAFLGTYSRLLIDLNRPLGVPSSIPLQSEDTVIPGNLGMDDAETALRAERIFRPFHDRIAGHLDERIAAGRQTLIVAVHSFTPIFLDVPRPWHAGVLYDGAKAVAEDILALLRLDDSFEVAANQPYEIARDSDYTIPVHGDDRGIPAVLIEIRQDGLQQPVQIAGWANKLGCALQNLKRHC